MSDQTATADAPSMLTSPIHFAGDLKRAGEVAAVLVKYGLAGGLTHISWEPLHNALKSHDGNILANQTFEERFRLALTDLGTTFIKLGQMLSTRPDLVGHPLAVELSKLQEQTPADPPEVAIQTIESELHRPISECFTRFEPIPTASASVGQAHRARLKTGRRAIVKVQHPGIEDYIRKDLEILAFLAQIAQTNEQLRRYQPVALIHEFSHTTLNELDFLREFRNLQTFRRNFADDETVAFPKPYPRFTTCRVLTMQYIQGHSVANTAELSSHHVDRQALARTGANVFLAMIFRDGFYHADPHPGNILILPNGKIALIDAGMIGRIDDEFRREIEDVLLAVVDRDARRLADAITRLCGTPQALDHAAFNADLAEYLDEYANQAVAQFNLTGALTSARNILHNHRLVLPGRVSMLIKCLVVLEGTGQLLSPNFNLTELLRPWSKKILWGRFSPKRRLKAFKRLYADWERMAETLPRLILNAMDHLEKGKFAIRLEHRHLKSAANRVVGGLFISSLLVASALLITRNIPPLIAGLSVLGMFGYAIAIVFGFRMLWVNRDEHVSDRHGDWE